MCTYVLCNVNFDSSAISANSAIMSFYLKICNLVSGEKQQLNTCNLILDLYQCSLSAMAHNLQDH